MGERSRRSRYRFINPRAPKNREKRVRFWALAILTRPYSLEGLEEGSRGVGWPRMRPRQSPHQRRGPLRVLVSAGFSPTGGGGSWWSGAVWRCECLKFTGSEKMVSRVRGRKIPRELLSANATASAQEVSELRVAGGWESSGASLAASLSLLRLPHLVLRLFGVGGLELSLKPSTSTQV